MNYEDLFVMARTVSAEEIGRKSFSWWELSIYMMVLGGMLCAQMYLF